MVGKIEAVHQRTDKSNGIANYRTYANNGTRFENVFNRVFRAIFYGDTHNPNACLGDAGGIGENLSKVC